MKVYIGPYQNWWRSYFYVDYMDKKYNYNWDAPNTKLEKLLEVCAEFLDWFYSVTINRYFAWKKRKIRIKIHNYDTWSMDNTLAHIIIPMLKQLKESKHGAPFVDDEDVPDHLRSTAAPPKENEWDTDDNHFKRWDWVMNEMIYAFEMEIDDDWEINIWKKYDEKWTDDAFAERKLIQNRISNGFRLFGKYYQCLWD